jgi:hypothetical protein
MGQASASETTQTEPEGAPAGRRVAFPSAVTTLVIVTLLVWLTALFSPPAPTSRTRTAVRSPGRSRRSTRHCRSANDSSSSCLPR